MSLTWDRLTLEDNRECVCGHHEHLGGCRAERVVWLPAGSDIPSGSRILRSPALSRAGRVAVGELCLCVSFREREGL